MMFIRQMIPSSRFCVAAHFRVAFVLALLGVVTHNPVAAVTAEEISSADACTIWLAPSNLNTESTTPIKIGLYAGKLYTQNSTLPLSELAIPIIDFFGDFHRLSALHNEILTFLEDHVWTPEYVGSRFEGNLSSPAMIPGIGVLANYHTGFSNADFLHAAILLRDEQQHATDDDSTLLKAGEAHLMRGAVTPYFNATLQATQTIPAGMEIFANFGNVWDGNFTENVFQDKIHRYDYDIADGLVNGLVEFYDQFPDLSIDLKEDIMDFMLSKVLGVATGPNAKTINSLIPANPRKLKKVKEAGGTFMYRYQDMIKSTTWLQNNGICLDTIQGGISSIPNAGRGAFASRDIRKGETITITPMLHIADKDLMTMYPIVQMKDEESGENRTYHVYNKEEGPIGQQLLLNYAFGHPESSMLLFPVGPQVTLINNGGKAHNSFITWTRNTDPLHVGGEEYAHHSVQQMAQVSQIVLTMKIVADRDIRKGEEITLDYGNSWQDAWESYTEEWEKSKAGRPHPLKAQDLKSMYRDKPLETVETLKENPYPDNVNVACYLQTWHRPDGTQMKHQVHGWDILQFSEPRRYENYDGHDLVIISEILDRKDAPGFFFNYTVRVGIGGAEEVEEVMDVPHAACTFVDQPYSSDIFMQGAFRHPIGIPDSVFPMSWRNLIDETEEIGA